MSQAISPTSDVRADANRMNWLQVLRGLAAVKILLVHAYIITTKGWGPGGMAWLLMGYFTVPFFFILSGYVMGHAMQRLSLNRVQNKLGFYLTGRAMRVFLPYWPVSLAMVLLYTFGAESLGVHKDVSVLSSLTLWPSEQQLALKVAWTLQLEWMFYVVCATWFVRPSLWWATMTAWFLALLAPRLGLLPLAESGWMALAQKEVNLYFFVGLALFHGRAVLAHIPVHPVASMLGFSGLLAWVTVTGDMPLLVVLALAGIVWSISRWTFAIPPILLQLGAASYAVYLVHGPVQVAMSKALAHWPGMTANLAFWLIALSGLGAGLAYHVLWERRVIAFTQHVLNRFGRTRLPAVSLSEPALSSVGGIVAK